MVNKRYAKTLKDLKGIARKIAEDNQFKHIPPFMQTQYKLEVPEEKMIQDPLFVEGDRVQIIKGKDRGKVGKIHSVFKRGNAVFVEGLGGTTRVVIPKPMWLEGQTKPVVNIPNPIPYENIRLVSQIKDESGKIEDVAVHSFVLEGKYFDQDRNQMMPIRRAKHDKSIIIPYPLPPQPLEPSKPELATPADEVDRRTFFPPPILESPVAMAALDQIRNPYSKWNKHKKVRPITEIEAQLFSPPEMPKTPATKKLLEELAKMPKPKPVEFTKEMEEYIAAEIEKGLTKRAAEETDALKHYN
ncbi:large ribosomal subunit protein uL24m [Trichomonascus vanleenenianus]|uniref:mitochondrial 54S ribosomal protein uL24m MRPL40 n=1 Tax=Trichomonascus vanleenenianus TaxID=2268995 RepID=UPI003EC9BA2B